MNSNPGRSGYQGRQNNGYGGGSSNYQSYGAQGDGKQNYGEYNASAQSYGNPVQKKEGYQSSNNLSYDGYGGNQYPNQQQQKQPQQQGYQRPKSYASEDYNGNRRQPSHGGQQSYDVNYNQRNTGSKASIGQGKAPQSHYDNSYPTTQDYSDQRRQYQGNNRDSYTDQNNQYNQSKPRPNRSSRPSILDDSKGRPPNDQSWQTSYQPTDGYSQPSRNQDRNSYPNGNGYDSRHYQNQDQGHQNYNEYQYDGNNYNNNKNSGAYPDQSGYGYTGQYDQDPNGNQGGYNNQHYNNSQTDLNYQDPNYQDPNAGNQWDSYGNPQKEETPTETYVNSVLGHNLKNLQVYPLPANDPGEAVGNQQLDSNYQQAPTAAAARRNQRPNNSVTENPRGVVTKRWNGGNSRPNLNVDESETSDISSESPQHQPAYDQDRGYPQASRGGERGQDRPPVRASKGATVTVGPNRGKVVSSGPSRSTNNLNRPANSSTSQNPRSAGRYGDDSVSPNPQDDSPDMNDYDNAAKPKPKARVSMKPRRPQQYYDQEDGNNSNTDRDLDYGKKEQRNDRVNQGRGSRVSVGVGARRGNPPDNLYNGDANDNYNQPDDQSGYSNRQPSPNRGARVRTGPGNAVPRQRPGNDPNHGDAPIPRPRTQSAKGKGSIRMR